MDSEKYMLLVNGQDKTDSVASFRFQGGMCEVVYSSSPKPYCYSIKGTLNFEHVYDYLIVDEASQVDLATGVLAFACARNIVIVGDLQQLPNVLDSKNLRDSE